MTKYPHTMIRVSSLEDSIAFFEVLGLHEIRRRPDEKGRGREYALDIIPESARTFLPVRPPLPDETPAHPLVASIDVASLCPNAEITVFPWREPPELQARTIEKVRRFLRTHRPAE